MKRFLTLIVCLVFVFQTAFLASAADYFAAGIDVSKWQTNINWEKVKADGNDFVIIRVGYSEVKDPRFEEHYAGAVAAGLHVGVYMYSYAVTIEEAKRDARDVLNWLSGKSIDYPIYYDIEDEAYQGANKLTTRQRTDIALAFVNGIKEAGYYPGVYSNLNWFKNYLYLDEIQAACDTWIAHYKYVNGTWVDGEWVLPDYASLGYGMYQYTQEGVVSGVSGAVDKDVSYKNYPKIIRELGLNGFAPAEVEVDTREETLYLLDGKWYYVKDKKIDLTANTAVFYEGGWHYVKNGQWDGSAQGLVRKTGDEEKWIYFTNGKGVEVNPLDYVQSVEIEALPQTKYYIDMPLSVSGGKIKVTYGPMLGTTEYSEILNMTENMITGFDSETSGEKELSVNYGSKTTAFKIGVIERVVGDVNGDEICDMKDVVIISKRAAGWDIECYEKALDVNGDGYVRLSDSVYVARNLVN
ncbi:MAG: hypothetical protein IJE01_03270 [Clostridia bacterium]|nr:hypothetical protein [Clostridia bacterium]